MDGESFSQKPDYLKSNPQCQMQNTSLWFNDHGALKGSQSKTGYCHSSQLPF